MSHNLRNVIIFLFLTIFSVFGVFASDLDYPNVYTRMSLPEYPGAVVLSTGRSSHNLEDGISLKLETPASHAELRSYYESRMAELGWILQETIAVTKMREAGVLDRMPFMAVFCFKDGLAYQITATDIAAKRQLRISITADAPTCLTK